MTACLFHAALKQAAPVIAGLVAQIINLNPDTKMTSMEALKSILVDPDYSLIVDDCLDSATCSGFTLSCDGFKDLYVSLNGNDRDALERDCDRATCSDLRRNGSAIWGMDVDGIDVSQYTNDELQWIGCLTAFDCDFHCKDLSNTMIEFGSDGTNPPRALLGPGPIPSSLVGAGCAKNSAPRDIMNIPQRIGDVIQLCRQLGYSSGSAVTASTNRCPKVSWNGQKWTSDLQANTLYATQIRCWTSNPCAGTFISIIFRSGFILQLSE